MRAVTCACSLPRGSCNLWGQDPIGGVLSTVSGTPPGFGSNRQVYFHSRTEVSQHILTATSPIPLPGTFARASDPGPTQCCRWSLLGGGSHHAFLGSLPPPSGQGWGLLATSLGSQPPLSGQGWLVSCIRAEKCSSLCIFLWAPTFAWLSEVPQLPLGPSCEGIPQCVETFPSSRLPPSLGAQAPVLKFSFSLSLSLLMSLSFILPHSRDLSLPLWRSQVFSWHLEVAL